MRNLHIKSIGKVFFKPEIVVGSLFFVVLLPIVLKISYLQNDDFYYFHMVSEFLRGNFILDPIIAPTFYVQGFLGMYFVSIFGLAKLPILTLLVSLVNFYIFCKDNEGFVLS